MRPSPSPSNGDVLADPGSGIIRYPGFGVCVKCGHDVEWVQHFKAHGKDVTQFEHHGRICTIVKG
jgi:hypothetical protein